MKAGLRIIFRVLRVMGGTLVVLSISAIGLFWYFAPDICGNDMIAEFPSPEGKRKVVVFRRNCGATTDVSTQASILGINHALENETGNVFTSDTDGGSAPSGPGGGPRLSIDWRSENSALLSFHPKARVLKKEPKVGGVQVHYSYSEIHVQQGVPRHASKPALR